ncbi:hypothetical protein SNE40_009841 [Patella caerulea]|uniref:Uncharacterized protein n=1 Tax=Patella caerulea TaxID=87958 RepID=A0AAN8JS67_PATCE
MQYVAEVSGKGQDIDRVKEQLLQSNPVLEGNYSTVIILFHKYTTCSDSIDRAVIHLKVTSLSCLYV